MTSKSIVATLAFLASFAAPAGALAQEASKPTPAAAASPSPTPAQSAQPKTAAPGKAPAQPEIVSVTRVVGEVGSRFVTSREVRIGDAVEQAIGAKEPGPGGPKVISAQEKTFPSEVGRALDEWIVFLEAKSFSASPPSRADVTRNMKNVEDFWKGKAEWSELEVSQDELRDVVERKLIAREFERLKGDSSLVPVSDADALAYFKKNRLRFGSLPFATFKDNIKAFLIKQQTERRLAEWHEVLRRKYKVRNFIAG